MRIHACFYVAFFKTVEGPQSGNGVTYFEAGMPTSIRAIKTYSISVPTGRSLIETLQEILGYVRLTKVTSLVAN